MDYCLFSQTAAPTIDGAYLLALVSRVLHILGAIVLVGGIAYLCKVVVPGALNSPGDSAEVLYSGRRHAWAKWVGIATVVLLATGFYNYLQIVRMNEKMPGAYHMLFGIKFLLALVVFFLAAILAGKTAAAERFRRRAKSWFMICLAAGIVVVVLAGVMRSFPRVLKADAEQGATNGQESQEAD